tara:strand:+ start:622 stop:939 length:318 start_codon:yes stop_codon:yes gene_type:complete
MSFRSTGLPESANSVMQAAGSSNTLVSAPGTGKHIVIYDVIVVGGSTEIIRDGSSGSIKMFCPEGHVGFTCPLSMGENKEIHVSKSGDASTSFAITITYSIESIH